MTNDPVLIAYSVKDRPAGQKAIWLRIGAAFPRYKGPGFTLLLNALPLRGRIVLVEPTAPPRPPSQVKFFPAAMPIELATRRALRGEKRVWEALGQAPLPAGTCVFYNRAPKGCHRRADMLIVHPERGVIAIEVKGGRVHYRAGFRQQLAGGPRWRKRIEPWGQAQRALTQAIAALHLNPLLIPQASMLAMPGTSADALPFPPGPHMLTAEDLAPAALARKLEALLPRLDPAACTALAPALESLTRALTSPADEERQWPPIPF